MRVKGQKLLFRVVLNLSKAQKQSCVELNYRGPSISSRISTNGELTRYWWIGWFTTTVHPAYKARRYKAIPVIWQMIWLTQMRPSFVIMLGYKAIPLYWQFSLGKTVGLISEMQCTIILLDSPIGFVCMFYQLTPDFGANKSILLLLYIWFAGRRGPKSV